MEKKVSYSGKLGHSAPVQESDRRGAGRVPFTITADIVELSSGARFVARTTDVSLGGCFVDTKIPFPVGTSVRVTLKHGKMAFETGGAVVYSQCGLGMGISFQDLSPQRSQELAAWILELTGEQPLAADAETQRSAPASADRAMLVRLVRMLIEKRILTEAEGTSVLQDPLL
jgi:PilZ domain